MAEKRKIRVFIASPSDLAKERLEFRNTTTELNKGFGDGADVEFEALGWENCLSSVGPRAQSVINQDIDRCEVFILVLHRRWGRELKGDGLYTSYTEEEFYRALGRKEKFGKPEIFVFFKRVDPAHEADAGPQLKKVLEFRQKLEDTRSVIYHWIDGEGTFTKELNRHLRVYAKGGIPANLEVDHKPILPDSALEEIQKAKRAAEIRQAEAEAKQAELKAVEEDRLEFFARTEILALSHAEEAAEAAHIGRLEAARQKFALALNCSANIIVMSLACQFYGRTGDFDGASDVAERIIATVDQREPSLELSFAFGTLGNIFRTRGELDRAKEFYQKSLDIGIQLGFKGEMAAAYGGLGSVFRIQGDLDKAKEFYEKSLEINAELGNKNGMARAYGSLGIVYESRRDLDKAEEFHQKSLELSEQLGDKEGMAAAYGNLSNVSRRRGDLNKAEEFHGKSLEIDTQLGLKKGMANDYGNLANVHLTRGDVDKAEELCKKSLELSEQLGNKEGMAAAYGNLGTVY